MGMLFVMLICLYLPAAAYSYGGDSTMPGAIKYSAADTTFNVTDTTKNIEEEDDDSYEELLVTLNVQRIGSVEIPAIINGRAIYLSIKELNILVIYLD